MGEQMPDRDPGPHLRQITPRLGLQLDFTLLDEEHHTRQRRHHLRQRGRVEDRILRHRFLLRHERPLALHHHGFAFATLDPHHRAFGVMFRYSFPQHLTHGVEVLRRYQTREKPKRKKTFHAPA